MASVCEAFQDQLIQCAGSPGAHRGLGQVASLAALKGVLTFVIICLEAVRSRNRLFRALFILHLVSYSPLHFMRKVLPPLELVSLSFLCSLYPALLECCVLADQASRHSVFSYISSPPPHRPICSSSQDVVLQSHLRRETC